MPTTEDHSICLGLNNYITYWLRSGEHTCNWWIGNKNREVPKGQVDSYLQADCHFNVSNLKYIPNVRFFILILKNMKELFVKKCVDDHVARAPISVASWSGQSMHGTQLFSVLGSYTSILSISCTFSYMLNGLKNVELLSNYFNMNITIGGIMCSNITFYILHIIHICAEL